MSGPHQNIDPLTGNCLDCGARREQLDDNIFPECAKFTGSHRHALIAINRAKAEYGNAARFGDRMVDEARKEAREAEDRAAYWGKKADEARIAATELQASMEYLLGSAEHKLSLGEAISRHR